MSIKTRIRNYIKNFSLRESIRSLVEIIIIVTIVDAIISPQDGIGKIALDVVGFVPTEVYMAVTAILVIWFSLNSISELDDNVKDMPFLLLVASVIGTIYFATQYILTISILSTGLLGGIVNIVFGIVFGGVIWFVGTTAIAAIAMSILGIDPSENRHKNSNTDDPYNDKHAAKILNQEDSS